MSFFRKISAVFAFVAAATVGAAALSSGAAASPTVPTSVMALAAEIGAEAATPTTVHHGRLYRHYHYYRGYRYRPYHRRYYGRYHRRYYRGYRRHRGCFWRYGRRFCR